MKKLSLNKHSLILKMTLVAVFAALNFVVMLLPKIPIPSLVGKPYVHLGNLVVVLVSIFFGGVIGGLSGAIGMGLYDIMDGYGIWTLKTVILKFGIGIITGLVYKLIKNRNEKRLQREMIYSGSFFLVVSLFTAILAFITGGEFMIDGSNKSITIPWPLYVFSFILGIVLLLGGIASIETKLQNSNNKLVSFFFTYGKISQKALFASSIGIIFNIFGELAGGFLKKLLTGNGVQVSLAQSIASIPATIINGCVVLLVVGIVFPGINKALTKLIPNENETTIVEDENNDK